MIVCASCGLQNAMTSSYCRKCGAKLVAGAAQIHAAVAAHDASARDAKTLAGGRNFIVLAVFLLVCAVIVRFAAVPSPPPPYLPAPDLGPAIPDAPAAAAPATQTAPPVSTGRRIQWRADNGLALLSACGLDAGPLQTRLAAIAAAQLPDGSFPGPGDRMERTALAALQLGVLPGDPAVRLAHGRAVAFLDRCEPSAPRQRTLVLMALCDAQAIGEADMTKRVLDLLDGNEAGVQAIALAGLPAALRRERLSAVRGKLEGATWDAWFDLILGQPFSGDPATYAAAGAASLAPAEAVAWSVVAWHRALMLEDQMQVLRARLQVPSAAAGDPVGGMPEMLAVLAATAPLRVQPFAFEP